MLLFRRTTGPASRTRWWAGIATMILACEAFEKAGHSIGSCPITGHVLIGLTVSGMKERVYRLAVDQSVGIHWRGSARIGYAARVYRPHRCDGKFISDDSLSHTLVLPFGSLAGAQSSPASGWPELRTSDCYRLLASSATVGIAQDLCPRGELDSKCAIKASTSDLAGQLASHVGHNGFCGSYSAEYHLKYVTVVVNFVCAFDIKSELFGRLTNS